MRKVFITEFAHDLEGLLFESIEDLTDKGSLFEFVMDIKELTVGDLILFCGDFYILKGRTIDEGIEFYKSEFAKTFDSLSEEDQNEWHRRSEALKTSTIPPYMWMHLIQMFAGEKEKLDVLYTSTSEVLMELLDVKYEDGEGFWLFDCFERHIKGFKKMNLKDKIQALKSKVKEYDGVIVSYQLANSGKGGFH